MRPVLCRFVVVFLALGLAFPSSAQSLVEVAKKERERRQKLRAGETDPPPKPAAAVKKSSGPKEPKRGAPPPTWTAEEAEPVLIQASAVVPIQGDRAHALTASEGYRRLSEQDPADFEARLGLARTYAASSNFSAARAEYRKVLEIDPYHVEAIVGIAQTYQWSGAGAQAREWYEKALALDPTNTAAEIGLGYVEVWNEPALAIDRAERLSYRLPGNADVNTLHRESMEARAPSLLLSYDSLSDTNGNALDTAWLEGRLSLWSMGDLRFGTARYAMSYDGSPESGTSGSGTITSAYGAFGMTPHPGHRLDLRLGVDQTETTFGARDSFVIGGASWKIGVGRRWSGSIAIDRDTFRYTTQALDEGIVMNAFSGSIGAVLTEHWIWDGGADYWFIDDYLNRDNRRFGAQTGIRYRATLSPRFPVEAGYLFRYFSFDENFGASFFSPASYRANQAQVKLAGTLGSSTDFMVQLDTGLQSYDLVSNEPLVAGTAMIGFELGRGYRFEVFGIRGDYLLLSDFGVSSNQIGARFRWKPSVTR